jgi:cytochrome P450
MGTNDHPVVNFDHHGEDFYRTAPEVYAALRARCPVAYSPKYGGFWVVSRYDDVFSAARDQALFSAARSVVVPETGIPLLPPLESDPPDLERFRSILMPALSPAAVELMVPAIQSDVTTAIEVFLPEGRCDVVEELANPIASRATMRLLGLNPADWRYFADPLHEASYSQQNSEVCRAARERIHRFAEYIAREVDARIETPGDDLISRIVTGGGEYAVSRTEAIDLVRMVIFGGMDTVMAALSNIFVHLGQDATARRALASDPSRIPRAIEEFLRLCAPVQGFARTVTRKCELGGQTLAKGDTLFLLWASANRDERIFENAESFVIDRTPNRHLTFGIGPHRCLGSGLARTELRIVLQEFLQRIPDYEIVDDQLVPPATIGIVNGWVSVPIVFNRASP